MTNMPVGDGPIHEFWMPANSHVVEISPPLPTQVEQIFKDLAATLGHTYKRVDQESVHASVSLSELVSATQV